MPGPAPDSLHGCVGPGDSAFLIGDEDADRKHVQDSTQEQTTAVGTSAGFSPEYRVLFTQPGQLGFEVF